MIVKLQPSRGRFSNFALLNSKVTAPIFTKISHDVDALVLLLIRALQNDVEFCLEMPEQTVKTVNFDVCKKAQKFIGYHSNVSLTTAKKYYRFIICIHAPTSAERLVKFS